jgi:hypothetical protein
MVVSHPTVHCTRSCDCPTRGFDSIVAGSRWGRHRVLRGRRASTLQHLNRLLMKSGSSRSIISTVEPLCYLTKFFKKQMAVADDSLNYRARHQRWSTLRAASAGQTMLRTRGPRVLCQRLCDLKQESIYRLVVLHRNSGVEMEAFAPCIRPIVNFQAQGRPSSERLSGS